MLTPKCLLCEKDMRVRAVTAPVEQFQDGSFGARVSVHVEAVCAKCDAVATFELQHPTDAQVKQAWDLMPTAKVHALKPRRAE